MFRIILMVFCAVSCVATLMAGLMINNVLYWGYTSIVENNGLTWLNPWAVLLIDLSILAYIVVSGYLAIRSVNNDTVCQSH